MDSCGKKFLVTGAGGFIGSHVVEELISRGADVRAYVHYNSENRRGFLDELAAQKQNSIEVVMGDIRDPHSVFQAVKGVDIVLHLGALIAIPYSYQNPGDVFATNVVGSLNIAEAARAHGVERLVHTSTSEVYGTARYVPMGEDHPLQGQSPYSASKIGADKCMESFYRSFGLPVVTLRPFNAYGPRQSMRAVIPTIINQALHESKITLGSLTPTRDFTFVRDTACAFVAAGTVPGIDGEVMNAGSGFEISILQLAESIRDRIGRDIPIEQSKARLRPEKSEVNRLFSDSSKAERLLSWTPSTTLEAGLDETIAWMKKHRDRYRTADYVV